MNNFNAEPSPPIVSQNPLDFGSLRQGESKTLQEQISNASNRPLLWHADIDGKKWLTIDKGTGALQTGQKEIVNVKVDTKSLAIGNHQATLIFSAESDASSTSVEVAVTLAVTPPPPSVKKGQINE
jgi:Viral BACON domain